MDRVLFVNHSASLGGAEQSLLDIAWAFKHQASVMLFEEGPYHQRLRDEGVHVLIEKAPQTVLNIQRSNRASSLLAIPDLLRFVRSVARQARKFDAIYANTQKAMIVGAMAGFVARRPVVWHLRDILSADHFSSLNRRAAVGIANCFSMHVIANSAATQNAFKASGGRAPSTVVYNGIDGDPYKYPHQDQGTSIRDALSIGDAPLVGVFSRIARWKGQHVLIEALSHVPKAHAVIVGSALFSDDEAYQNALRERVRALGLEHRVHFVGFQNNVPQWMRAVDIVVHTSTAPEPFGRVVVEGMLARKPVVASAAGGVLEIIDDNKTGWLFRPGDVEDLADTLQDVLCNPTRRKHISAAGYTHALKSFSRGNMVMKVGEVLRSVGVSVDPCVDQD